MKIPPFFTGILILFWGFETKNMIFAVLIFTVLESSFFVKKRWDFDIDDFIKISDLNSLILLSVVAVIVLNYEIEQALQLIQKWLPLVFLPIMTAQVYHISDKIIIATKLGQGKSKKPAYRHKPMNFSFIYIAIIILSAATANNRGYHFQIVLIILSFWFLFYNKRKTNSIVFLLAIISVSGISFILNNSFESSYKFINKEISNFWKNQYSNGRMDPYKSLIAIGQGEIKNSGKIIMRVSSDSRPPRLLKTASYNIYFSINWYSKDKEFKSISHNKGIWHITNEQKTKTKTLLVEKYLSNIQTLLPTPYGCSKIAGSDISKLEINSNNIIRLETNSDLLIYKVQYNKKYIAQSKPKKTDLNVTKKNYRTLKTILEKLNIINLSDKKKLLRIKQFFKNGFSYSLKQRKNKNQNTLLSDFLLFSKTGHCEYYATATALLLRAANIPTKYINGFVIDEKSSFSNKYIIRERHAHAWVEAYIDNKWEVVDTTPSIWLNEEKRESSVFEGIRDFFSFLKNKIEIYFKNNRKKKNIWLLIVIILILFLLSKILLRIKKKKRPIEKNKKTFINKPDSEFYLIIKYLKNFKIVQKNNETILSWMYRINKNFPIDINKLIPIYKSHLKHRFDPNGLAEKEQSDLKKQIEIWIKDISQENSNVLNKRSKL